MLFENKGRRVAQVFPIFDAVSLICVSLLVYLIDIFAFIKVINLVILFSLSFDLILKRFLNCF